MYVSTIEIFTYLYMKQYVWPLHNDEGTFSTNPPLSRDTKCDFIWVTSSNVMH